ncbi:MAG: hypothetical protein JW810_14625 [Sedimentisphaerales bacterium]|nr:hypothetical protein [Sedimentisphaerales bacterium]
MNTRTIPILLWMLTAAVWCQTKSVTADPNDPRSDPNFQFAEPAEAQALLARSDDFLITLSPFDRAVRMKMDHPVSPEQFRRFCQESVRPWRDADRRRLEPLLREVQIRLAGYCLRFPGRILLIQTSGREEANAAYTRQNAIILPQNIINRYPAGSLRNLLIHELFHVFSRYNPDRRDLLYGAIGFEPGASLELPAELARRKITNPDAPEIRHTLGVTYQGRPCRVAPVLYARRDTYDANRGGELFDYLVFKLMVVEQTGETWTAKRQGPEPLLLDPDQVTGFYEAIGRNTQYTIHPEEILAENFVLLVNDRRDLASPAVIESMRKILTAAPAVPD